MANKDTELDFRPITVDIEKTKQGPAPTKAEGLDFQPQKKAEPPSFVGEAWKTAKEMGTGLKEAVTTLPKAALETAMFPKMGTESMQKVGQMAASMVTDPLKQMTRKDVPLAARPAYAVMSLLGVNADRTQDFVERGEYGAAIGTLLPLALYALPIESILSKSSKMLSATKRGQALVSAVHEFGPPTGEASTATIQRLLPKLDAAAKSVAGTPKDATKLLKKGNPFEWLGDNVQRALTKSEEEFTNAKLPHKNDPILGDDVSSRIRTAKRIAENAEDTAYNNEIEDWAKKYEVDPNAKATPKVVGFVPPSPKTTASKYTFPHTLEWWDQERKALFKLRQDTSAQRLKPRTVPEEAAARLAEDAIKELEYGYLGRVTGKKDYFTNLKRDQFDLINLQDQVNKRVKEFDLLQSEWNNAPMYKKVRMTMFGHPGGATGGTIHPDVQALWGGPPGIVRGSVKRGTQPRPRVGPVKRGAAAVALGRTPSKPEDEE